jgi:hypothetical protein
VELIFGGFCQLSIDSVLFLTFLRLLFAKPSQEGKGDESDIGELSGKVTLETATDAEILK